MPLLAVRLEAVQVLRVEILHIADDASDAEWRVKYILWRYVKATDAGVKCLFGYAPGQSRKQVFLGLGEHGHLRIACFGIDFGLFWSWDCAS